MSGMVRDDNASSVRLRATAAALRLRTEANGCTAAEARAAALKLAEIESHLAAASVPPREAPPAYDPSAWLGGLSPVYESGAWWEPPPRPAAAPFVHSPPRGHTMSKSFSTPPPNPSRPPAVPSGQASSVAFTRVATFGRGILWLGLAGALSVGAFGFGGIMTGLGGVGQFVAAVLSRQGAALASFIGLAFLSLWVAVSFVLFVLRRFTLWEIGVRLCFVTAFCFVAALGSKMLGLDFSSTALSWLFVIGFICLLFGLMALDHYQPPAPVTGRQYHRKEDTIHGDARTADDWEIDEALRDTRGGFKPMFKD